MADGSTAAGAGETTVCDQRHSGIQLHAGDGRGRAQHLTHARAAGRSLITNHHHITGLDLAGIDGADGGLLRIEYLRGSLIHHHLRCHSRTLHDGAVGCNVAEEHSQTAGCQIRLVPRADDLRIPYHRILGGLTDGLAQYCHTVCMDQAMVGQLLHHGIDAACLHEILHMVLAGRRQVAEVRCLLGNLIDLAELEGNACLMRHSQEVQCRIGGAAQSHICGQRILNGLFCDNVLRPDILLQHLHNLHARLLCQTDSLGVNGRNGAVAGKGHAQNLTEAVHGVCGKHAGAGTAGRTGGAFDIIQLCIGDHVGLPGTYRLEYRVQITLVDGKHGTAGNENAGQVQTAGCQQHARYDLVAVGDEHQRIQLMTGCHTLDGVCNQLTGAQRKVHAVVTHGDTVADRNGIELEGCAAGHEDAVLHRTGDLLQVHMTRHQICIGIYYADQRLPDLLVCIAGCLEQ